MNIDLIAAAHAAHAETLAAKAQETATESTRREEEQQDFLRSAADHTAKVLGPTAADLSWLYTAESDTPEHTFVATASLASARAHDAHLAFTFDAYNSTPSLAVVRICRSCTHQLTDEIGSLADLGRVLDEDQAHGQEDSDGQGAQPGPLAALEAWETRAAGVSQLTRRLIAEYPDAGLTVSHITAFGHSDGSGRTEVQYDATSADAVRQIAAALDAEVTTRHSGTPSPYGVVLEHTTATGSLGLAVDVTVRGYTQLPDEEAAAWRAQQDQPAEAGDA